MIMGDVKGYNVTEISKKKVIKENFPAELREQALDVLKSKGYVYAYTNKQKEYVCCYMLRRVKEQKENILVLENVWTAPEFEPHREEADQPIQMEAKEKIIFTDVTAVKWNETIFTKNDVEEEFSANWLIGFSLGILYAIIFDDWAIGMGIGLCLGVCFRYAGKSELIQIGKNKETSQKKDDV
ncbi:MAG: hypothetical protein V3G42_04340 [Oscillospiraceae bacterium]